MLDYEVQPEQGIPVDVNTWDRKFFSPFTRINLTGEPIGYACAVTDDLEPRSCRPPVEGDRIIGFTVQITDNELRPGSVGSANPYPFYAPGRAVAIVRYWRIQAEAPCDVEPGNKVYVEPGTGRLSEQGIIVVGCTWESYTQQGRIGILQVDTRL